MKKLPDALHGMALMPRWLVWFYRDDETGKPRKIPYGINGGLGLTDAATGTYEQAEALRATNPNVFAGVGYVPDCSYACLDFDGLGTTSSDALKIWRELKAKTYCEFSPSRLGGHSVVRLSPTAKARLKGIRNIIPGVELYADSGYFTVTGDVISDRPLIDASKFLMNIADHLGLQPRDNDRAHQTTMLTGRAVSPDEVATVVSRIRQWSNGWKFIDLYEDMKRAEVWADRAERHPGPDTSDCMVVFLEYVLRLTGDKDLAVAVAKSSALWGAYQAAKGKYAADKLEKCIVKVAGYQEARMRAKGSVCIDGIWQLRAQPVG